MFRFIFRTITLIIFLSFVIIGIAVWKGGDPFRRAGDFIEGAGKTIVRFGDFVDDVKSGGKKIEKTFNQLKETISEDDLSPAKKN